MGAASTYPGVYIEELSSGQHTITGVATSIAAFVGWAPQGPVSEATLIQSWSDYQTIFGGLDSRSKLGYAVNQFFGNGGSQCYIVRLVWDGTIPPASGSPAVSATAAAGGLGYAVAQFTAAVSSVTGNFSLGIGTPSLQSIAIAPSAMPPIPVGATVALVANPTYTDGGSSPALSAVTWTSSNPAVVTVAGGLATAVGSARPQLPRLRGSSREVLRSPLPPPPSRHRL